jgi:hypothetical protein
MSYSFVACFDPSGKTVQSLENAGMLKWNVCLLNTEKWSVYFKVHDWKVRRPQCTPVVIKPALVRACHKQLATFVSHLLAGSDTNGGSSRYTFFLLAVFSDTALKLQSVQQQNWCKLWKGREIVVACFIVLVKFSLERLRKAMKILS